MDRKAVEMTTSITGTKRAATAPTIPARTDVMMTADVVMAMTPTMTAARPPLAPPPPRPRTGAADTLSAWVMAMSPPA
jgi:hypothetical protein